MKSALRLRMLALLILASTQSRMASAEEQLSRFVWSRGAGAAHCPDGETVKTAVQKQLGRDPFSPSSGRTMTVEIVRRDDSFQVDIRLVNSDGSLKGSRNIVSKGATCDDMIDTIALSISIALDPENALGAPKAEDGDSAEPPPPEKEPGPDLTYVAESRTPDERPVAPSRTPLHLEGGMAPALWLGAGAGSTSLGGLAFVALRHGAASIAIEGRTDLPSSARIGPATVETSLVAGGLVPCVHVGVLGLCAVGVVGRLGSSSRGISRPVDDASLHVAVGARLGADIPIGFGLYAWIHLDGLGAVTGHTLAFESAPVHDLSRWSVGLGAGLRLRFF